MYFKKPMKKIKKKKDEEHLCHKVTILRPKITMYYFKLGKVDLLKIVKVLRDFYNKTKIRPKREVIHFV